MQSAVSAGHEITLEVAKNILQDGGNAFDAAIAAYMAMFITEPCMASAGGNGFALLKTHDGPVSFMDFFCQTPQTKNIASPEFYPITVNFGTETEEFFIGLGSACVPGAIAAIFEIYEKYATIPFEVLTQPAKDLAKNGVVLNTFQAYDLELLQEIFAQDESVRDIFFKNGSVIKEGDLLRLSYMVDFLEFIEREGAKGFYQGDIGKQIAKDSKNRNGFLKRSDFEDYKVNHTPALEINWHGKKLYLPNGPSKGGIAMAAMLYFSQEESDILPKAIERAQDLIGQEHLIYDSFRKMYPHNNLVFNQNHSGNKGTSHFNILDKHGNAVSLTTSIGEGSGYFIPNTNMQLNNMLGEIFLLPNGAHSWAPNTRLNSMMTPAMLLDTDGNLEYLAGSGGASRIPYAIGQVIYQIFENKLHLHEATEAGRYHFQNNLHQVEYGARVPPYDNKLVWDKKSLYFGGVHSILKKGLHIEAVGDARRYGVAEVF